MPIATAIPASSTSKVKTYVSHPLDPLSPLEITDTVDIIKQHVISAAQTTPSTVWFKYVTLDEPAKAELVPYLEATGAKPFIKRGAKALVGIKSKTSTQFVEYNINLTNATITSTYTLKAHQHVGLDYDEMQLAEEALLACPIFQKAVDDLKLPSGAVVVADPWIYGADTLDAVPRLVPFMVYYRLREEMDSNHYSYPLPLIPSFSMATMSLSHIDYTPIFSGESTGTVLELAARGELFPWEKLQAHEYDHALQLQDGKSLREDLKPLQVVQPEGPSFSVDGHEVSWQKWNFRVGFNYREGLTIHNVVYDGRPVFYRLSVSDMTVPYGDPRAPLHRKQAFDLGDVGAGICANQLDLGCDCLGTIKYLSADLINSAGEIQHMKNVICIHEQDEGIGSKHTNFRTGKPTVTRNRTLVVQQIITVANYEYIFAWKFDQAAAVHLETRATGILSTCSILPGETSPYGTIVNPGVLATNHQHLFSVRIDPAIDSFSEGNTIVQEDSVTMPFDKLNPPSNNLWGVGYTVEKTPIKESGWADAAPEKNRIFKMINPAKVNPISGRNVGYKLVPAPSQLMLAHPDSIAHARAEFGNHHIWVTKYQENELFSAGTYTNQSNGNAEGIRTWVARNDEVENADVVLWHTFGLTHNPRVEDFPVMPCETHSISLKPVDFFTGAPCLDVPPSRQQDNKSTLVQDCCK